MSRTTTTSAGILLLLLIPLATSSLAQEQTRLSGLGASKKVNAVLVIPQGEGPFPGVLVLHTSGNVDDADITFARALAEQGYAAIVPYYFDPYGISSASRRQATTTYAGAIFNDLVDILGYLQQHPRIQAKKLGAVGFSMGEYWVVVLAARGRIQAGVSYYGALTGGPGGMTADVRYRYEDIFNSQSSPVLILHGSADSTVRVSAATDLGVLLRERRIPHELQIYQGVEHAYDRGRFKNDQATRDSWEKTLSFLRRYLKQTGP